MNRSAKSRKVAVTSAALTLSAIACTQAVEIPVQNGSFDTSSSWYWEDWSDPRPPASPSTATFDAAMDSGGATTSGSLKLASKFIVATGWQQAVYTLDFPDLNLQDMHVTQISADVRVDPSSTLRAEGDYGGFQLFLRTWDWIELGRINLTGNEWRRLTWKIPPNVDPVPLINNITALSIQHAENGMQGPVTVNVDNITFNDALVVSSFDNDDITPWVPTFGTAPQLSAGDDAGGKATSGSLHVNADYITTATTWQQAVVGYTFPTPLDTSKYLTVEFDIKVDSASPLSTANNYGYLEVKTPQGAALGGVNLAPTATEWTHISYPLGAGIGTLNGFVIQLGSGGYVGPISYSIDNVIFTPRTAPAPPPTLNVEPVSGQGVSILATGAGATTRQNIRTAGNDYSFLTRDVPVTYSFTIAKMPANPPYANFQTHIFLVPGTLQTPEPDWNAPTLIFLDIRNNENGTATATFRHKFSAPDSNTMIYGAGALGTLNTTPIGTWSITVNNKKDFVVTGPDGSSATFTLSDEAIAAFWTELDVTATLNAYIGVQANAGGNAGQGIQVTRASIKAGTEVLLEDDFSTPEMDTSKFIVASNGGAASVQYGGGPAWVLTWTLPDTDFTGWQWTTQLTPTTTWTDLTFSGTPVNAGSAFRQLRVPLPELPTLPGAANQFYLRMVNPTGTPNP